MEHWAKMGYTYQWAIANIVSAGLPTKFLSKISLKYTVSKCLATFTEHVKTN